MSQERQKSTLSHPHLTWPELFLPTKMPQEKLVERADAERLWVCVRWGVSPALPIAMPGPSVDVSG